MIGVTPAGAICTDGPPACASAIADINAATNIASATRFKLADS
jgi:hypothetical protein